MRSRLTVGLTHERDVGGHGRKLMVRDHGGGRGTDLIGLGRGREQAGRRGLVAATADRPDGPDVQLR